MAREVYLYEPIGDWTAERFNKQLSKNDSEDTVIRMMTRGGYTPAGVAMLTQLESHQGEVMMSVDGDVSSMGAFMLLFADKVQMSDMAELMFHKAAFPSWYQPSDAEKENLERENKRFQKRMESRLGDKGSELIAKVFAKDKREDVRLTASQAKKIGLVDKIIKIQPSQKAAFHEAYHKQMLSEPEKPEKEQIQIKTSNTNTMEITKEEFDQKIAAAREEGRMQESQRVAAWAVYMELDSKTALAGIQGGENVTPAIQGEMQLKAAQKAAVKGVQEDNVPNQNTPPEAKTAEQIRIDEQAKQMKELFKKEG